MPAKNRDGVAKAAEISANYSAEAFSKLATNLSVDAINQLTRNNATKVAAMPKEMVSLEAVIKILRDFGMPWNSRAFQFIRALKVYRPNDIAKCEHCELRNSCSKGLTNNGFCSLGVFDLSTIASTIKEDE